jgi:uncharacterized protein YkwD
MLEKLRRLTRTALGGRVPPIPGRGLAWSAGIAAAVIGPVALVAGSSAGAERHVQPAAPDVPASIASVYGTTPPLFSDADWQFLGAALHFVAIASTPTATPLPATPTAVPPTPAPPAPTATPASPQPPARNDPPPATPVPAQPTQAPRAGLDMSPMNAYEQALFDATNRRRVANGLPPLQANLAVVGVARIRSHDMADHNYFAHTSPITGDTAFSLMDAWGIAYGWAGENLAVNNYPDGQFVTAADEALWNSAPHRENMLSANYTQMGIGLAIRPDGMKYFTIIFIGPPL